MARSYKFKMPGLKGACGPIPDQKFKSAHECRKWLKTFLGLSGFQRLPRGYRVWPVR